MNLKKYLDAVNAAEARVQSIAAQINTHFEAGETDQALEMRPQLDTAKADASAANQLYISMRAAMSEGSDPGQRFVPMGGDPEPEPVRDLRASNEYMQAFFNAFRSGVSPKTISSGMHRAETYRTLMDALTETGGSPAGSEGGFLLPVDFDNMIHELMRQYIDLANSVNVETVTAYSGWRAVETAAAALPFAALTENDDIPAAESPTFTRIDYTVVDYGGYLPVSNDLLSDTPVTIMQYLSKWFAKKAVLTNNSLILTLWNALSATTVADSDDAFDAIKTALNKGLDPDVAASASVFVNQTGFDLLDQLVDGTGRPIMQPDPVNATLMRIKGRPVVQLADRLWPNLTAGTPDYARMLVGDGRELTTFFRRAALEMAATTIGGDSWRKNNTEVRAIMRAVAKTVDAAAGVLLKVAIPE